MISLTALVEHLNQKISPTTFPDFPGAHNGLQLETSAPIRGVAAAVDASFESLKIAIEGGYNFVLVHHGLFWQPTVPIIGPLYNKFAYLIQNQCAVYSAHLPLDAHAEFGNNKLIADLLELQIIGRAFPYQGNMIGFIAEGMLIENLMKRLEANLPPKHVWNFGPQTPKKIAICSGSGAGVIEQMKAEGIDTLITGELRQAHYAQAQELELNIFICGHYATEVFGVQKLGAQIAADFNLPFKFISSECPL